MACSPLPGQFLRESLELARLLLVRRIRRQVTGGCRPAGRPPFPSPACRFPDSQWSPRERSGQRAISRTWTRCSSASKAPRHLARQRRARLPSRERNRPGREFFSWLCFATAVENAESARQGQAAAPGKGGRPVMLPVQDLFSEAEAGSARRTPPRRSPAGCGRARSRNSSGRNTSSRPANCSAARSRRIACRRSSFPARREREKRRWPRSSRP